MAAAAKNQVILAIDQGTINTNPYWCARAVVCSARIRWGVASPRSGRVEQALQRIWPA